MKSIFKIVILLFLPFFVNAQKGLVDSLYKKYNQAKTDSAKYYYLHRIYGYYEEVQKDSALVLVNKMLALAQKNNQYYTEFVCKAMIGYQLNGLGKNETSLDILLKALNQIEDSTIAISNTWSVDAGTIGDPIPTQQMNTLARAYINHTLGIIIFNTGNVEQAEFYFRKGYLLAKQIGYKVRWALGAMNLGRCYGSRNNLDSGLLLLKEAAYIAPMSNASRYLAQINSYTGDIFRLKSIKDSALHYYYKAASFGKEKNNITGLLQAYFGLARIYKEKNFSDSGLHYSNNCLQILDRLGSNFSLLTVNKGSIYQNIYECFLLTQQKDSINKYRILSLAQNDSIKQKRVNALIGFQNTLFKNQARLQQLEKDKLLMESRNRTIFLAIITGVFILLAAIFYYNNRQKQKANKVLETTLTELKSTQSQLIQSEKMASLGELTAGIAHEIQNPLNFVNNFSELNVELSKELGDMVGSRSSAEADIGMTALINDISSNSEKINHHGKRASDIVKGMLQHSRTSTGQKEPTDINALCDEYLRLAYHGLRAKDKTFNAQFETHFDPNLPKVNVVPQDMGRVVLNIINNAFFAVGERSKVEGVRGKEQNTLNPIPQTLSPNYVPLVSISTRKQANTIEVTISDNGGGIPADIKEKIFQPFFTTKPTGQGTGLGLSLAYDIVTKVHGGKLTVESELGKGTIFKIEVPMSS